MNLYAIRTDDKRYVALDTDGYLMEVDTFTYSNKFASEQEAIGFIRENRQLLKTVFHTSIFTVVIPLWTEDDYQNILERIPDEA